jgi:hypothetical protein
MPVAAAETATLGAFKSTTEPVIVFDATGI